MVLSTLLRCDLRVTERVNVTNAKMVDISAQRSLYTLVGVLSFPLSVSLSLNPCVYSYVKVFAINPQSFV